MSGALPEWDEAIHRFCIQIFVQAPLMEEIQEGEEGDD